MRVARPLANQVLGQAQAGGNGKHRAPGQHIGIKAIVVRPQHPGIQKAGCECQCKGSAPQHGAAEPGPTHLSALGIPGQVCSQGLKQVSHEISSLYTADGCSANHLMPNSSRTGWQACVLRTSAAAIGLLHGSSAGSAYRKDFLAVERQSGVSTNILLLVIHWPLRTWSAGLGRASRSPIPGRPARRGSSNAGAASWIIRSGGLQMILCGTVLSASGLAWWDLVGTSYCPAQAFRINKSGPCCLSTILRCTDLTGHQPSCASAS